MSGWTKEINDFALGGEIEAKNLKSSLFILSKMIIAGEEPIKILFQISSTVRKLLTVKSLIEEKTITRRMQFLMQEYITLTLLLYF